MSKIKPCPFCGSSASTWYNSYNYYCVMCDNDDCGCEYGRSMSLSEDEAIKLWNYRSEAKV